MRTFSIKCSLLLLILMLFPQMRAVAQDDTGNNAVNPVFTDKNIHSLSMEYDADTKEYTFTVTGADPYVFFEEFTSALPADSNYVSFEYCCTDGIPDMQIYLPKPLAEANSISGITLAATKPTEWVRQQISLDSYRKTYSWGAVDDYLRFDFGNIEGVVIKVRNVHIGAFNLGETLEEYVNNIPYTPDDFTYGTAPGLIADETVYVNFYDAYNDAVQMLGTSASEAEQDAMYRKLKAAYEAILAAVNPISDGNYFIQTAYSVFGELGPYSWYAPRIDGYPGWKLQETSKMFMWEIKNLESGNYSIKNLATGQYINHTQMIDGDDSPLMLSDELTTEQVIERLAMTGQFLIHSNGAGRYYNVQGHSSGTGTAGPIASWTTATANGEGAWKLIPVTADELAEAESKGSVENLSILIAKYNGLLDGAEVGTAVGMVSSQELVDNLLEAIETAQELIDSESSDVAAISAAEKALTEKGEAYNADINNIPDGYYKIRSTYEYFVNNYNYIYLSIFDDDQPGWDHEQTTSEQIWKITKVDGGYTVQNAKTGLYLNKAASSSNGAIAYGSTQPDVKQQFNLIKPNGCWNISNDSIPGKSYVPASHWYGANNAGAHIIIWESQGTTSDTSWNLEKLTDEDAAAIIANEAQNELNISLDSLYEISRAVYSAYVHYTIGDPIITDINQVKINNWSPNEGANFENLIDGNKSTFWNSTWEGAGYEQDPDNPHYLRVYCEAGFPDTVQVNYVMRQSSSWHRVPRTMRVDVSNDDTNWTPLYTYKETDFTLNWNYPLNTLYSDSLHYIVTGLEGYKYVRFITMCNIGADNECYRVGNGHQMMEYAEYNLYPVTGVDPSSAVCMSWNKPYADELFSALQEAKAQYLKGTAKQSTYDRLLAAVVAFKNENYGDSEVEALYPRLNEIATNAEVGEGLGYVDSQDAIDNFWNKVEEAWDGYSADEPTISPRAALQAMNDAYDELASHVEFPQPNVWYNIISNSTRAYAENQPLYLWSTSTGDNIHIGGYQIDTYGYRMDPYAIWRLVPAEDEAGAYYIQSMGTGQYFGAYRGQGADAAPLMSHTPGVYKVYFYGTNGGFRMRQTNVSNVFDNLKADGSKLIMLNYPANGDHQQAWRFEPIDMEEGVQFNYFTGNNISIVTLPWATKGADAINAINGDDFITYAVKNLEITEEGTRLELTRKDEFEAGEPMIIVNGDYTSSEHPNVQVMFNTPTDVVDSVVNTANGLVGTLEGITVSTVGMGYFESGALKSTTGSKFFDGRSGYIDPGKVVNDTEAEVDLVITTSEILNGVQTAKAFKASERVNVYSVDGVLVKKNVKAYDAAKGLKKGIYIVGGKKVLVK